MPRTFVLFLIAVLLFRSCVVAADSKDQFKTWYQEFGPTFEAIMEGNCSTEYEKYLTVPKKDAPIDWFTGGGNTNRLAQPVANCILGHTSDYILSNMAAAAVVLGLMPTILAMVGNSVEETSTLCVIGQRPLLSLMLAAGSPAIFPIRSFEYVKPMKLVKPRRYRLRATLASKASRKAVLVIEYLFAVAIIVNTYTLSNQLGVMVVSMLAPQLTYLEFLWSIIGVAIHLSAAFSLWARTRITSGTRLEYIQEILWQQFRPLDHHVWNKAEIKDEDTYLSMALSYFTSLLGTCHVIYGSMLFSSLVFISATDSLTVLARYMGSAMASRIILMHELFWLRHIVGDREELFGVTDTNETIALAEIQEGDGKRDGRGMADSRFIDT